MPEGRDNSFPGYHPSSSSVSSAASTFSVSSSYRHHQGPFVPQAPTTPQPKLTKDSRHEPKTRGSVGILVVGLGGANGCTLSSGILANRNKVRWHGPQGQPKDPSYGGCITQLEVKGSGVGMRGLVSGLADANFAAIGGWDVRPRKLGDALYEAQIIDYDLTRQIRDDLNQIKIFRGYYDPRFIRSSQHATATHILDERESADESEALKCLRADIRYFRWRNGVVGHTTVIWSASVEPNSDIVTKLRTAGELLESMEMTEAQRGGPLPPSLVYATAALLEGCSFVNGGSQNTLSCPGLQDLARRQIGMYCLGTDFKAGSFKMTAVEHLRTMGLIPKVITSSTHLGKNDMQNLTSQEQASKAKLQVKHDIFTPWQEDIDHKVGIVYTEMINEEKRDFVEYTSLGFMNHPHTMVTYTRASDSILCVPLMIDVAVWCDFFAALSWPPEKVERALAYLFKVPEGAAKSTDPGFFAQMEELKSQVQAASKFKSEKKHESGVKKRVRIIPEDKTTEWAIPHDARIICAGLACVDMQLNHASGGDGGESIETFEGEKSIGGGSVSMACKTLARLCHGAPLSDGYMQVSPPVVNSVVPLCMIGADDTGTKLLSLLESCGNACRNVDTKYSKYARRHNPEARTALAVLPIYKDGRRGCFFDAASNATFSPIQLIDMIQSLSEPSAGPQLDVSMLSDEEFDEYQDRVLDAVPCYGAFLFGYPHLLPKLQGAALVEIVLEARELMIDGGIFALDLNGVPDTLFDYHGRRQINSVPDLKQDPVLGPVLEHVDILHMNEDELVLLTGCQIRNVPGSDEDDLYNLERATNLFLRCGVGLVAVTRGKRGSYIAANDQDRFQRSPLLPSSWADCTAESKAAELPPKALINTNGAGDSFTAGLLVAAMLRHTGMTVPVTEDDEVPDESDYGRQAASPAVAPTPPKKRQTPYQLYMRENYVTLKQQCNDDRKAIFVKCHEMWENESEEVKSMYKRKAKEEEEMSTDATELSHRVVDEMEVLDDSTPRARSASVSVNSVKNAYMTNRSLTLESAAQFASLVAAHHVDVSTRDEEHLDVSRLLERAMIIQEGLEEI